MENNELDQVKPSAEMVSDTILQIEKDFAISGFTYQTRTANSLPALVPELLQEIVRLKEIKSPELMRIIYRVDLTEKQYARVNSMVGDQSENLAKAIVLRSFQKVHIRRNYKA
jgi:hypothetical protein